MLDLHLLGEMEIGMTMSQGIDIFLLLKIHIFHLSLILHSKHCADYNSTQQLQSW